jgi:hypothetical protein
MLGMDLRPDLHKDGLSFAAALRGEDFGRGPVFSHFPHRVPATGNLWNTSVREGPWKLYRFYHTGADGGHRLELYNLATDLGETRNLAALFPEKAAELDGKISAFLEETDSLVPLANPRYHGRTVGLWSGNEAVRLEGLGDTLRIELLGDRPAIRTNMLPSLANAPARFAFEIRSTEGGVGTFAFLDAGQNDRFGKTERRFRVHGSGEWETFSIPFTVTNRIREIRLQPLIDREGATVELRRVRLLSQTGTVLRAFEFP